MIDPVGLNVYVLMYGEHHALHQRLYESFKKAMPRDSQVIFWCNQVCKETRLMLGKDSTDFSPRWHAWHTDENVPKYKVMHKLFWRNLPSGCRPLYHVWFDDDSYLTKDDWFQETTNAFGADNTMLGPMYVGQAWFWHWRPGQWDFIKTRPWYRDKPPELIKGKPGIKFATGGYWWLHNSALERLTWPDVMLSHNGGDTLLGEACRQNDMPLFHFDYGVKVNDAPRRGHREIPLGEKR